ncbi:MAG: copper resistance protein [Microbacteriaceae bacterium]|nr:copper resistance protein [Microbacteriaceae bacterium]
MIRRARGADPGRVRRAGHGAAFVVALMAALALPALPASAHDELESSSPTAGSTVTHALPQVSVTFEEAVLDYGRGTTLLQVTGADGRHYETACAAGGDRTVSAPVRLGGAGRYTMTWRVVSADGHPVSDSISFTYQPPSGTPASSGSASGPDCGGTVGSTAPDRASADPAVTVTLVAAVGGLLILLVAGAVVLAVVLSRRSRVG